MNRHRKATYAMRREVLLASDISKRIKILLEEETNALATSPLATTDQFEDVIKEVFPFDEATLDRLFDAQTDKFAGVLLAEAKEFYDGHEKTFGEDIMRKVERDIYLQILDNLWMQHLENMDHLREGIHWISVGQRDPLVEYRRQGQALFDEMLVTLRHDVVRALFHAEPVTETEANTPVDTELTRAARKSVANASTIVADQEQFEETDFVSKKSEQQVKKVADQKRKKAHKVERQRKKAHKVERQRKKAGTKRKKKK
jgi:preprotein translocase subunit SecA